MSILKNLHNKLNTEEPPGRSAALVQAALTSAFAYTVLALGIIYYTYTADPGVIDSILLVKYSWVFSVVSAIACLSIAHYFYYSAKITTSLSGGVTMLLFMQILINASMFYMLFMYIHVATDKTHNTYEPFSSQ